jgi:hypothetical protein
VGAEVTAQGTAARRTIETLERDNRALERRLQLVVDKSHVEVRLASAHAPACLHRALIRCRRVQALRVNLTPSRAMNPLASPLH